MTGALTWLALALGVVLVPLPSAALPRAESLAMRGRLNQRSRPSASWTDRVGRAPVVPLTAGGGLGVIAVAVVWGGLALGLATLAVVATIGSLLRAGYQSRRVVRRDRDLRTAIGLIVAELESGGTPAAALAAAAEAGGVDRQSFARAGEQARNGGELGPVFAAAGGPLQPIRHAWQIAESAGAALADVLARIGTDLAAVQDQRRAVTAALAGPRSSALLLAGLPLLGIVLGAAMGADPFGFLFGSPTGRLVCCVGVLLDACGVWWTQRLLARALRP